MENTTPNADAPAAPFANQEIEALKSKVSILNQQLTDFEKGSGRSFELLKWVMGVIFGAMGMIIAFAGVNWWTGKANYERDKDFLKQEALLLEQRLALSQKELAALDNEQFVHIREQLETNWYGQVLSNDKQLEYIRTNSQTAFKSMLMDKSKDFDSVLSTLKVAITNLDKAVDARFREYGTQINNAYASFQATNLAAVSNLLIDVDTAMAKATGISLAVQGSYLCKGNRSNKPESAISMGVGISSLAKAGSDLVKGGDETDLKNCLEQLLVYFPNFIQHTPRLSLCVIDDMYAIASDVDRLTMTLQASAYGARYDAETVSVKNCNDLFKRLVKESREARLTPRK